MNSIEEKRNKTIREIQFDKYLKETKEQIELINKGLEVKKEKNVIYRPTVIFLYSPCDFAIEYIKNNFGDFYWDESSDLLELDGPRKVIE